MNNIDSNLSPDQDGLDWGAGRTIRPLFNGFALSMLLALASGLAWMLPAEWSWNGSQVVLLLHLVTGALAIILYVLFVFLHQPRKEMAGWKMLFLPWRMFQQKQEEVASAGSHPDGTGQEKLRRLGHAMHWVMLVLIVTALFYAIPAVAFKLGHIRLAGYAAYLVVDKVHLVSSVLFVVLMLLHIPFRKRSALPEKEAVRGSALRHRLMLQAVFSVAVVAAVLVLTPLPSPRGVAAEDLPFYSRPFGSDPFYPAEWKTTDGMLLNWRAAGADTAKFCADCHQKEFREWASSLHAVTGTDILYDSSILANEWESEHGGALRTERIRWCDACHEPLNVLSGGRTPFSTPRMSGVLEEGATCILCHSITATDPLAGNAAMTTRLTRHYPYLDPALIMAAPSRHAKDMQARRDNPLMGRSEFCGSCHTEIRPNAVNGQFPVHLQETFDEWRRSDYARRGVQCQDCHMSDNPAETIAGLKQGQPVEKRLSHRFVGNNYLLNDTSLPYTFLRGGNPPGKNIHYRQSEFKADLDEQRRLTLALLQSAAELTASVLPPDEAGQPGVAVSIANTGAGHSLPTGPLDQRYLWIEIQAVDAAGKVVYHSGWFDKEKDEEDPDAVKYIKHIVDDRGAPIKRHMLFDVARMEYSRAPIESGATDTVTYRIPISAAEGAVSVEVRLWYRIALKEILENVRTQVDPEFDAPIPPVVIGETKLMLFPAAGMIVMQQEKK